VDYRTGELELIQSYQVSQVCEMSMISFLKIIAALQRSQELQEYSNHEGIIERLGLDYKIKMGFGLHLGWAIEGPIGSQFKIDASYLSPNVNMASRLEAATKQFGVPLLFSGQLFDNFSIET
jgi:class 3 adenylate cyclase